MEVRLRNHTGGEVAIEVYEAIQGQTEWSILNKSHPWTSHNFNTLKFAVTVPANGGVFSTGNDPTFPTGTFSSSSYWVDVVFRPTPKPVELFANNSIPSFRERSTSPVLFSRRCSKRTWRSSNSRA